MPHSSSALSISQAALALLWILSGDYSSKIKKIKENKIIQVFLSIFIIHIVGLIYSLDFYNGLNDLKIKLPLLVFPLIIATSEKLDFKEIKLIIYVFIASILLKIFYGLILLSGITGKEINEMNQLSGRFSHIRYALLLNISIFSLVYILLFDQIKTHHKLLLTSIILLLSIFLFLLHSLTGWVVFIFLVIITIIYCYTEFKSKILRRTILFTSIGVIILAVFFVYKTIFTFYHTDTIDFKKLDKFTESGNIYKHDTLNSQTENGHFVYLYICEEELENEWNKISSIKYQQEDKRFQKIKSTLIRYLTSKGYRKDKSGILKLSKQDVENIENGIANYIYANKYALYPKIHEVLWQIDNYRSGGSPDGHSVTQRIEFFKTGIRIIKGNFWTGVGTGGQKKAFAKQYLKSKTKLSEKYRLRTHNQYLTIFITLGVFGFLWFIYAFFYLIFKNKNYQNYPVLMVFTVICLSMLNEDTLETQMGATIFAFFLSIFIFSTPLKLLNPD